MAKKINFTDDTFIVLPDFDATAGSFTGENDAVFYSVLYLNMTADTKTDLDGNTWEFGDKFVKINNTRLGLSSDYPWGTLFYHTDNGQSKIGLQSNTGGPFTLNEGSAWIEAVLFDGRTTGTYGSIGEIIAKGQEYYNDNLQYGYYIVGNILQPLNTPLIPYNAFVGKHSQYNEAGYFDYGFLQAATPGIAVTLTNSVEDFDPVIGGNDPYDPGGNSTPGGGGGDFDNSSDASDFPGLPSLSAADTGFITLYNPSLAELQSLASYMWGGMFDLNTFKKIFADPMDAILGLSLVPVNVPSAGAQAVTVGNISTGVTMTKAAHQFVEVDCGSINVKEYWGAYLDYEPYTKAELYLPYIGTHAISVDDIMGKTVHVKYHVDILSGACTAYVKCGDSIKYEFIGQCASSIPISGTDFTNVVNGVLTIAGSIGSMVATGGATAPLAIPALATTALNDMKPDVEKSGSMSGTGGLMAIQTPYMILTRPRQAVPNAQSKYTGYPSFMTKSLAILSGYTEVETIRLNGMGGATDEEISEISNLLKSGVIL